MKRRKRKALTPTSNEIAASNIPVAACQYAARLRENSESVNHGDAASVRQCAINDLVDTSSFLKRIGIEGEVWERFYHLASALDDLNRGTVAPFLMAIAHNRQPDSSLIWRARTMVAIALDCFDRGGKSRSEAVKVVAQRAESLGSLLRKGTTLETACVNWLNSLRKNKAKNWVAQSLWQEWLMAVADPATPQQNWEMAAQRNLDEAEAAAALLGHLSNLAPR